ncbi:MAG TPA: hypothetical protein VKX40_05645 [Aequorivita sp.]|nr:hypothetical protein [Aequorivita sp.]
MKQLLSIVLFLAFTVLFSSCATTQKAHKNETELTGYNLKSKKEQMQRKILLNRNKALLAVN